MSDEKRDGRLDGDAPLPLTEVIQGLPSPTLRDPIYLRMIGSAGSMNCARFGLKGLGWLDADQAQARLAFHAKNQPAVMGILQQEAHRLQERFTHQPWLFPDTVVADTEHDWAPLPFLEYVPTLFRPWALLDKKGDYRVDSLEGTPGHHHRPWHELEIAQQPSHGHTYLYERPSVTSLWSTQSEDGHMSVRLDSMPGQQRDSCIGFQTTLATGQLAVRYAYLPMPHVNRLVLPVLHWRVSEMPPDNGSGSWDEVSGSIILMDKRQPGHTTYKGEVRVVRHTYPEMSRDLCGSVEWQMAVSYHILSEGEGVRLHRDENGIDGREPLRRLTIDYKKYRYSIVDLAPDEEDDHRLSLRDAWRAPNHNALDELDALLQRLVRHDTSRRDALDWLTPELLHNPPEHLVDLLLT